MSAEITKPNNITYWIITDGKGYANGQTGPEQVTTVGNGWGVVMMTNDHNEYLSKCQELSIMPRAATPDNLTPVEIIQTVSARQIRLWLIQNGIDLNTIDEIISLIPDPALRSYTKVEWEYAPYIERNHPMLVPLAIALGLTEEDINRAFIEASLI
jgi:hypothetical protein